MFRVNALTGFGGSGISGGLGTDLVVEATRTGLETLEYPAGSVSGNLIIALAAERNSNSGFTISDDATQTWTELVEDTGTVPIYVAHCVLDTSGSGQNVTVAGDTMGSEMIILLRISGYTSGTIQASSVTSATSIDPDPASITPSWGIKKTLFIPFCGLKADPVTGFPSGYTGTLEFSPGGEGIAAAWEVKTVSSENPTVFTANSGDWRAVTVAVEPA